jgi:predicted NBD/HSP70 family sugar kinase
VVDEVLQAARAGESDAVRAVEAVARWTGVGLANLVNCLNPEMVVLGGLLSDLLGLAGAEIRAHMRAGLVTPAHLGVQVVAAELGAESVLLGAAEVALEAVLSDPTLVGVLVSMAADG